MFKIPESVSRMVLAICADYGRREAELRSGNLAPFVRDTYRNTNMVIDDAVASVVTEKWSDRMLSDLINERSYPDAKCKTLTSRSGYRRWKLEIFLRIAEAFGYIDPSAAVGERHCAICGTLIREAEFGSITVCRGGRRAVTLDLCPECSAHVDGIEIDGTIGIVKQSVK